MAIQRVPGQMLESNLTRSTDLAFQTDLLYLDVSNNRVGIKTDAPGNFALDVNGTSRFQDNVTISGNLTVTGETTVVNTTNMEIEDNILVLNGGGSTGNDAGLMINRGGIGNNAVFYWDEVDDKFKFVITPSDGSTITSIDDSTLARIAVATPVDSDDAVTKNYVDTAVSGVGNSFNIADDGSTTSNVLLNDTLQFLGGNNIATTVSGNTVTFTGSKDININSITSDDSTAIQINDGLNVAGTIDMQGNGIVGVADPSNAQDVATKAYVDTRISATNSLTVGGDDSSEITLDLDTALNTVGAGGISTSVSGDTLTITLDNSGVSANTYGSSTAVPVITVDAQGRITNVTTSTISTTLAISDDTSTESSIALGTDTLQVLGGNNISTQISGSTITVVGATDINVNSITSTDSSAIQLNDHLNVSGNVTIAGDLTADGSSAVQDLRVRGNLTVDGTQTILNTSTLSVEDNILVLNRNVSGSPTADAGIEIERGDEANKTLIWDETTDKWTVGSDTFVAGTFEGNVLSINEISSSDSSAIQVGSAVNVAGNIDVQGNTVTGLGTPSADSDAATKAYVDTRISATNSLTVGGDDSSEITLDLDTSLNVKGGTNISTSVAGDTLTITGATDLTVNSLESADSTAIQINDGLNVAGATTVNNTLNVTGAATLGTSLTLPTGTTVTAILDEDTMSSNSDTALATQQSIKAYVDAQIVATNTLNISDDTSTEVSLDLDNTLQILGGNNISTAVSGDNKLTITGSKDINVNSISSDDSTAIQINDGLNVAGNINVQGNTVTGLGTPSADSDAATKSYVDTQISANNSLTIGGDDSSEITLDFDTSLNVKGGTNISTSVTGDTLTITGATDLNVNSLASTDSTAIQINDGLNVAGNIDVQGNTVTGLATPSANSDAATKAYVDSQVSASNSLTIGGDDSSEITLDLDTTLNTVGEYGIATRVAGDTLTIRLTNTAVLANTYGSSTEIPQITVDAQGRITNIGTNTISTTLTVSDDTSTEAAIALGTDSLQILGGNNISTQISGSTITVVGATDINVNSITSTDSSAIQLNDDLNVSGNITIAGDLTADGSSAVQDLRVRGNLTVDGTQTILNTETLSIEDNILVLNRNVSGAPSADAGIEINRGDEASKSLLWNESTDKWTVGSDTFVAGTFEGNVTGDVAGNLTGNIIASDGSTIILNNTTNTLTLGEFTFNGTDVTIPRRLVHNGDSDTYIGFDGANYLSVSVGGTQVLESTSSNTNFVGTTVNISNNLNIDGNLNVNSISSDDSTAIQINDGLNVAGNINVQGNTVTGLATPSADSDAATKSYVDSQVSANNSLTLGADDSSEITLNLDTTLNIKGGTGITTSVTGDTLTITGVNQAQGISFGDTTSSTISIPDGGVLNLAGTGGITATVSGDTLTIDGSSVSADLGDFTFSGNKLSTTSSNADFEIDTAGTGNVVMSNSTSLVLPKGTVAERPATATAGAVRYNSDIKKYEVSEDGTNWISIKTGSEQPTDNTVVSTIEYNKLTATATVVDEFDQLEYAGAFYHVSIEDVSNNLVGQVNVNVVRNSTGAFHTVYDKNEDSTNLVTWSTAVSGNSVQLKAEANAQSSHVNLKIQRVGVSYYENTNLFTNSKAIRFSGLTSVSTAVDTFEGTNIDGAKYYAVFQDTTNGEYEATEILVVHDGSSAYITSYGGVSTTAGTLATYTALYSNGYITLSAQTNGGDGTLVLYRLDLGKGTSLGTYNNVTYRHVGDVDATNITTIDSFEVASRKTAKYIVNLYNIDSTAVQTSEISVIHNGSSSNHAETSVASGSNIGNFTTDVSGGKVRLRFQGSGYNNTRITFARFDYETPMFYKANADTTGSIYASGSGALHIPSGTTAQRPSPTPGVIRFNTTTSQYEVSADGSSWQALKTQSYTRAVTKDVFAGDGSTQTFTSANVATDAENLLVYIDGVIQEPDINYTINIPASTITITDEAPHSGARVVVIRGFAEDVPLS